MSTFNHFVAICRVLTLPSLLLRFRNTIHWTLQYAYVCVCLCRTYLIFVPQNLSACVQILFGLDIPASYFLILMLLFQIPLSWIRDIRKLTITNLVANILILYGLITCLGFAISTAARSDVGRSPLEEIGYKITHLDRLNSGWFLFIGTSVSQAILV